MFESTRTWIAGLALVALVVGCGDGESGDGTQGTYTGTSGPDGESCEAPFTQDPNNPLADKCICGPDLVWECDGVGDRHRMPAFYDASILFVVDGSPEMAGVQDLLVQAVPSFLKVLDDANLTYRIGVTSTNPYNQVPPCTETLPLPSQRQLVASSCRERLDHFSTAETDAQAVCTDNCTLETLEKIPTEIMDRSLAERAWLEKEPGGTNLKAASMEDALKCLLPQGIAGCPFQIPLDGIRSGHRMKGGFDEMVMHASILVTNGSDCTYNGHPDFLDPNGERTFWSDPMADHATQAACWRAGVECSGGPGTYDDCVAVDKDEEGNLVGEDEGELRSLREFIQPWELWKEARQETHPAIDIILAGIVGVPPGYPETPIPYADATDAAIQDEFGIGPGCSGPAGPATPPVRVREVVETLRPDRDFLYSVCEADYAPALVEVAEAIVAQQPDGCLEVCAADADDFTPGVQPLCGFFSSGDLNLTIEMCDGAGENWSMPEGERACFRFVDASSCGPGKNARVVVEREFGFHDPERVLFYRCVEASGC